jgi:hypothetical protein
MAIKDILSGETSHGNGYASYLCETEVQFFQDFVKAHAWIEMITNDWYDDNY